MKPKVIVNNGFGNFHMSQSAKWASDNQRLSGYITGGYPPAWLERFGSVQSAAMLRLRERDCGLPRDLVYELRIAEIANQIAGLGLRAAPLRTLYESASAHAISVYQRGLRRTLSKTEFDANIFHYRSGFAGNSSLHEAKRRGLFLLCDHSIAHPEVLPHLMASQGRMGAATNASVSKVGALIRDDLRSADHYLVNSEFVKSTFIARGIPDSRIAVVYTLPEAKFLSALDAQLPEHSSPRMKVLFAGTVSTRKGAAQLFSTIARLSPTIDFTIAGTWDVSLTGKRAELMRLRGVRVLGQLARLRLASEMSRHHVFFFPTLAEGSARAVAEAMAAGCAVVTTPNAGSLIPCESPHQIVDPWDQRAMEDRLLMMESDRKLTAELGSYNRKLIASALAQGYGPRINAVYETIVQKQ